MQAVFSIQCVIEKGNHNFVPLEQLENVYSQIDIPSDFKEIDSSGWARKEDSLSNHFYKSSLSYSEVKGYFNNFLIKKAWVYNTEETFESISADESRKRFGYKKEGCELWIEYAGLSPKNNWNYGVSLVC